jgi:uncharacterized protein
VKRALLIGEYAEAKYHPLTGVDVEIRSILDGDIDVEVREDYGGLTRGGLADFDLLISYVDVGCFEKKTSKSLVAALITFLCDGGGLLAVHNGIFMQHNHELAMALGARLTKHPPYTTLQMRVSDREHPITRHLEDFDIGDEPYTFEMDCLAPRSMLLEYRYGNTWFPAAWCHPYGSGRIVYIAQGHNAETFKNRRYRRLIQQSARWLVGDLY